MDDHHAEAYLVNTGWIGGSYGIGNRISLKATRSIIDAILDGSITKSEFETTQVFNVQIPKHINGVDSNILKPSNAWQDQKLYIQTAHKLSQLFNNNFKTFLATNLGKQLQRFGPKL